MALFPDTRPVDASRDRAAIIAVATAEERLDAPVARRVPRVLS